MSNESTTVQLCDHIDTLLSCSEFEDYCPNGLQIQGRERIVKLASAVTASVAAIEKAVDWGADALLVHHGIFWSGDERRVVGMLHQRLRKAMIGDLNLLAYHLPLDAHPTLGNNAQLGKRLGLSGSAVFGPQNLGWIGRAQDETVEGLIQRVVKMLGRTPVCVGDLNQPVGRVAWCTGGAQSMIQAAAAAGANTFISGEISENTTHIGRELGICYLSCGHHATERYGVQALGEALWETFGFEHRYFELDNPA